MVNWALGQGPNAFERAFEQGFQRAEYSRQRREQESQRNALAAYATNPSDVNFNALASALPEFAIQERGRRDQAAQAQMEQDMRRRAAMGDPAAMSQLAGIDTSAWNTLNSAQRQRFGEIADISSNVAQRVLELPPEQQAGAWQQQMTLLAQRYPELGEYANQYSPEFLQSTIAEAGDYRAWAQSQQPDYMAIPEGGTLVNTRNPQAVQSFQGAPQGPANVPSGSPLAQPAPSIAPPAVGAIEDGYRFRGGNPADPNSWEPVGQMSAPVGPQESLTREEVQQLSAEYGPENIQRLIAAGRIVVRN